MGPSTEVQVQVQVLKVPCTSTSTWNRCSSTITNTKYPTTDYYCHTLMLLWYNHVIMIQSCYYDTVILWYYDTIMLLWYNHVIMIQSCYYDTIMLLWYSHIMILWYNHVIMIQSCYYDTIMLLWYNHVIMIQSCYYDTIMLLWYNHVIMIQSCYYDTIILLWYNQLRSQHGRWCAGKDAMLKSIRVYQSGVSIRCLNPWNLIMRLNKRQIYRFTNPMYLTSQSLTCSIVRLRCEINRSR